MLVPQQDMVSSVAKGGRIGDQSARFAILFCSLCNIKKDEANLADLVFRSYPRPSTIISVVPTHLEVVLVVCCCLDSLSGPETAETGG